MLVKRQEARGLIKSKIQMKYKMQEATFWKPMPCDADSKKSTDKFKKQSKKQKAKDKENDNIKRPTSTHKGIEPSLQSKSPADSKMPHKIPHYSFTLSN